MSYNNTSHQSSLYQAGKITIMTTLVGVVVFVVAFLFNISNNEYQKVEAQSQATTSVNVLNTPPQWLPGQEGQEEFESSVTNPTNSGDEISWVAIATDSNAADYYLIICSGTSTPTIPTAVSDAAPTCANGQFEWAVSTATVSDTLARAATTTIDRSASSPFAESNDWYAWVCDADSVNPRCFSTFSTGTAATNSAPFIVNSRPEFTAFGNDSPADPGATINFLSTSTDSDSAGSNDTLQLFVCNAPDFGTGTSTTECGPGGTIATSTLQASNASTTYTLDSPLRDQDYAAYGYILDNHGHQAVGGIQGSNASITVNNVAPFASSITLNGGRDIVLLNAATQTPNFVIEYVVTDNNSCQNFVPAPEVVDYELSVYRSGSGNSSTTCDVFNGPYDANDCYTSIESTEVWNVSCTASTTASDLCTGTDDATETWSCSFPLWYIADPTDDVATATPFSADDWRVQVVPIDDDGATTTPNESPVAAVDVLGLLAFSLDTAEIPYGPLEPGSDTGTLSATTTVRATGNVGIDELLQGTAMCNQFSETETCNNSASSTIPENNQEFSATSSLSYGLGFDLSSTTAQELEINIPKPSSTSSQPAALTYWGIAVPGTISFSGDYFGQNTFTVKIGETVEW